MIFKARTNSRPPAAIASASVNDYLDRMGVGADAIDLVQPAEDPLGEFIDRHHLYEDSLRTVEGRKGAELRHRLTARMMVLCTLIAPMVVIPFWLMWLLSPANIDHYDKEMRRALLGALATNVLGLCWVITRDLFPQGGAELLGDSDDADPLE